MSAIETTLSAEAARYLEAVDFFRSLGSAVSWHGEGEELGTLACVCERCGSLSKLCWQQPVCLAQPTAE